MAKPMIVRAKRNNLKPKAAKASIGNLKFRFLLSRFLHRAGIEYYDGNEEPHVGQAFLPDIPNILSGRKA
jgi:hypothetical protein